MSLEPLEAMTAALEGVNGRGRMKTPLPSTDEATLATPLGLFIINFLQHRAALGMAFMTTIFKINLDKCRNVKNNSLILMFY